MVTTGKKKMIKHKKKKISLKSLQILTMGSGDSNDPVKISDHYAAG